MISTRWKFLTLMALVPCLCAVVSCQKGTQTTGYLSQGTMTATVGSTNFAPGITEAVYSPVTYSTFAVIGLQSGKDTDYLRVELPISGFTIGTAFSSDTATSSGLSWFDSQRSYEYDALFGNGPSPSLIDITSWDRLNRKAGAP